MHQNNALSYLPLVQALVDGKTIQYRAYEGIPWVDLHMVAFDYPASSYRIKPEPEPVRLVPLGPEDIEPGTVIGVRGPEKRGGWSAIVGVTEDSILGVNTFGEVRRATYEEMMLNTDWFIKRPGGEWQPCSKPA